MFEEITPEHTQNTIFQEVSRKRCVEGDCFQVQSFKP